MANRYGFSNERKRSPFSVIMKVIVEFIVIVIGIYLAFQLENKRETKNTIELEKKYLIQLLEEAKINRDELEADQAVRREQVGYLRKILEATQSPVHPDTLRKAMGYLLMVRVYSPTDAVYQDLVSSGNLGIIKSDAAKRILLNYRRSLSRVPITEATDIRLIQDKLEPYLIKKQVLSLLEPHRDIPELDTSPQQLDRIIRALLNDREFLDLVYLRTQKVSDVIYFENPMQWLLRNLITVLEKELAKFDD